MRASLPRAPWLLTLVLLAAVLLWPSPGVAEEQPAAPTVDRVEPVAFHSSIRISGDGEFGGTIRVEETATGYPLRCEGGPIVIPVWDGADVGPWECVINNIALHNPDPDRENSVEVTVFVVSPQGVQSAGTTATVHFLPSTFSLPSIPDTLPPGDIIEFAGTREMGSAITIEWNLTYENQSLFDVPRVCWGGDDPSESDEFVCTYDSNEARGGMATTVATTDPAALTLPAALPLGQYTATLNEMFEDQVINSISFGFTVGDEPDPIAPEDGGDGGGGPTDGSPPGTTVETIPLAPLPELDEPDETIPDGPATDDPETTTAAPPITPVDDDVLRVLILAIIGLTVMALSGARGMGWPRRLIEAPVGAPAPQRLAEPTTRDAAVAVIAGLGAGGLEGAGDDAGRARPFGDAWGDRSTTWRFPGWPRLDHLSRKVPVALAPRLPLVARTAADAAYLRAALGVLWILLPAAGVVLGVVAAASGGAAPLPPALGLVAVLLVLAVLDASAGIAAVTAFTVVTLARGGLTAEGLHLDEGVRGLMGLTALWFVAPLVAAAARPLRRTAEAEHVYSWDRIGDTVIAALISGWAVQGIVGGLGDLAGRDLAITSHADRLALLTIAAVVGRFLLEETAAALYPQRLRAVQQVDELPAPTTFQQVRGLLFRAGLLAFFAGAFLGSCWQLWVGVAIFAIPQVLQLLGDRIPDIKPLATKLPRGVVQTLVLVLVGTAIAYLVDRRGSDDQLTAIRQGFVLLALPGAALEILSVFGGDAPKPQWTWPRQLAGAVVVAVTAGLVLFLL